MQASGWWYPPKATLRLGVVGPGGVRTSCSTGWSHRSRGVRTTNTRRYRLMSLATKLIVRRSNLVGGVGQPITPPDGPDPITCFPGRELRESWIGHRCRQIRMRRVLVGERTTGLVHWPSVRLALATAWDFSYTINWMHNYPPRCIGILLRRTTTRAKSVRWSVVVVRGRAGRVRPRSADHSPGFQRLWPSLLLAAARSVSRRTWRSLPYLCITWES
jgi:hypothetical protein